MKLIDCDVNTYGIKFDDDKEAKPIIDFPKVHLIPKDNQNLWIEKLEKFVFKSPAI
jgi:hypothetical protein